MRKKLKQVALLAVVHAAGWVLGIFYYVLRVFRLIRVRFEERLPRSERKMIVVLNHPSLLEPFLAPVLFFREFAFRPSLDPWSVPDWNNFYGPWYWSWVRARAIPVPRGDEGGEIEALREMKRVLEKGGRLILFPEGGRTFKGEKFRYGASGKRIRALEGGIGVLVRRTGCSVLPIWIEGTDTVLPNNGSVVPKFAHRRPVIIKVGRLMRFHPEASRGAVTEAVGQALLALADEGE